MKHKNNWYYIRPKALELNFTNYIAHMTTEKPKVVYKKEKVEEEK